MSESTRPDESPASHGDVPNPRRDFIKMMVTAVAGLSVAGSTDASVSEVSRSASEPSAVVTQQTQGKLAEALDGYAAALRNRATDPLKPFFSTKIDFRSTGAIVRTWSDLVAELGHDPLLYNRADAFITHVKWLAPDLALVDGNFPNGTARAWFTEMWRGSTSFTIDVTRLRSGPTDPGFQALESLARGVVPGDIDPELASFEEGLLRDNFLAFRAAFNSGDVKNVTSLTTATVDAIPIFSFLEGRAQILTGQAAVAAKAARMLGEQAIASGSTAIPAVGVNAAADRATYVAGEPKLVRFLSPTIALVDGTAEINNIPAAHEYSPSAMRGIYSTVWTKVADQWKAEATRPWF